MITIFIRRTNGKGEKIHIEPHHTVTKLAQEIIKILSIQQSSPDIIPLQLYHRGQKITETPKQILSNLQINNNSIIHVIQYSKDLAEATPVTHVKFILMDKLLEYDIATNSTIIEMKKQISQDLQIKEEDLTLSYLGVQLQGDKLLEHYNFTNDVLLSAHSTCPINALQYRKAYSLSRSNQSDGEGVPKASRSPTSPRKKVKKAESLNIESNVLDLKSKNNNFCSVRLNKIDEKIDESKNYSQINQSEEDLPSEKSSQENIEEKTGEWPKPKMTLDQLGKPWYDNEKIIETQSIIGDDEQQQFYTECYLQLTRTDRKRRYTFQCTKNDTFQQARNFLASLEKVAEPRIKIIFNFDEVSKSNISNRSNKSQYEVGATPNSPRSEDHRPKRNSQDNFLLSPNIAKVLQAMKGKVLQKAIKLKTRQIPLQYEIIKEL